MKVEINILHAIYNEGFKASAKVAIALKECRDSFFYCQMASRNAMFIGLFQSRTSTIFMTELRRMLLTHICTHTTSHNFIIFLYL